MNPLARAGDEAMLSEAIDWPELRLQKLPLTLPNRIPPSPTSALAIVVESAKSQQHSGSQFSFHQTPVQPELRARLGLIPAGRPRERNSS